MLETLLYPKTVAVVGASRNPEKVGYAFMSNLKQSGFQGNVVPINLEAPDILGFKCYKSLDDYPATIDLSVIVVGNKYVKEAVVKSIKGYVDSFAENPIEEQPTIAVLVPRNARGVEVVNALRQRGIEPIELISSTSETRAAAGSMSHLLSFLADPQSARKLAKAYEVWRRDWREQRVENRESENSGVESSLSQG